MKLILLRHGKSSWKNLNLNDFERPLSKRGIKELPKIFFELKKFVNVDMRILCSTSLRTIQTYEIFKKFFPFLNVIFLNELYHASNCQILEILNKNSDAKGLIIIGHNPGIILFLNDCLNNKYISSKTYHFPTSAAAILNVKFDKINKLKLGKADLIDFLKYKTLNYR